jgi:large subunit ribosomal protein L29
MNANDFRGKTQKELEDQLLELRQEQFNLRMQRAQGQTNQTHQFKRVRRDIARLKTVMGQNKKG